MQQDLYSNDVQEARSQLVAKLATDVVSLNIHSYSVGRIADCFGQLVAIAKLTPGGIHDLDAIIVGRSITKFYYETGVEMPSLLSM